MSFLYILSDDFEIIDFAKSNSNRFNVLNQITDNSLLGIQENQLISLKLDSKIIEYRIKQLLKSRIDKIDIPTFSGRFYDDDIFVKVRFNESTYELCNSGFDNQIIFLINIFNAIKNNQNIKFLLLDNHKDFKNWRNTE